MNNYCRHCGAKLQTNNRFCPNCGRPVDDLTPKEPGQMKAAGAQSDHASSEKKKWGTRKTIAVILVIAVAAGAVAFTGFQYPGFFLKKEKMETAEAVLPGDTENEVIDEKEEKTVSPDDEENKSEPDTPESEDDKSGFVKPEIPEMEEQPDDTEKEKTDEDSAGTATVEPEPEGYGQNEPYSLDPSEGMHVDVGKNVLYEGTELTVEPITEMTEDLEALNEELKASGEYMIGAWEVDAGLEPDQHLPGDYHVTFDLAELGISEEYYPAINAYRVTDDGTRTQYNTELEDGKLSYSTDQNSISLLSFSVAGAIKAAVTGVALFGAGRYAYESDEWYYVTRLAEGSLRCSWDRENKYGSYKIIWSMDDVNKEQAEIVSRSVELEEKHAKEAKEMLGNWDPDDPRYEPRNMVASDTFNMNDQEAITLYNLLKEDAEYMRLQELKQRPRIIQYIAKSIDRAYQYLGEEEKVQLPKWCMEYRIRPDKDDGGYISCTLRKNYIVINAVGAALDRMLSGTKEGNTEKDNLLLTITHETFHACQSNYHTEWSDRDSNRFDEMTAVMLEADAKTWFKNAGIISTDPSLTPRNNWGTLNVPLDYFNSEDKMIGTMQKQGYLLSQFLEYLRDETGNVSVKAGTVLECSNIWSTPSTTGPVKRAFDISTEELQKYWEDFCVKNRLKAAKTYYNDSGLAETASIMPPKTKMKKNKSAHVTLSNKGDYTMAIRAFQLYKNDKGRPFLVILDSGTQERGEGYCIMPAMKDYVNTPGGFYISAVQNEENQKLEMNETFLYMMEERSVWSGDQKQLPGYTVWVLDAPETPELTMEDGQLKIQLPKPEGAAEAGVMDGLLLTIKCDGKKIKKELDQDAFGTLVAYDIEDLLKEMDAEPKGAPEFSVTLREFVKDADENLCFGLPSEKAEYSGDLIDRYLGTWSHPGSTSTIWTFSLRNDELRLRIGGFSKDSTEHVDFTCTYEFVDGSLKVSNDDAFPGGYVMLTLKDEDTMRAVTYGSSGEKVTMTRMQDE